MKTEYTLNLGCGFSATVVIAGIGQQKPDQDDKVLVTLTLSLPADPADSRHLHPELEFGERVMCMDQQLRYYWGGGLAPVVSQNFSGETWKEARRAAALAAREAMQPLKAALTLRASVLTNAGDWE